MINGQNLKPGHWKAGRMARAGPAGGQMEERKRITASRDGQRKRREPLKRRQKTRGLII
ncbi:MULTISPECIES: hypothetical protein [Pannonibacter]|uniref:hypothetical protein n=1 Tax=Pannonibacter TaxID=227873 RepID=UPI001FCC298C|nr:MULTISPECIES: hypothetical protein [Pannonibacter]